MNKEIISEFIYTLINDGIKIWVESNENLKLFVPNNKLLTDSQKLFINRNKEKICYYLKINKQTLRQLQQRVRLKLIYTF